ncbi:MAG: vanillate O-demethylase oxidoreductase VanB [Alphaproteobacteria bacterium]|nr:MAG: vanillate O-demethylase oxidoreductase VanB [Alphaproteobacteria bacterium]
MSDFVEKNIEIAAPVERVWRALTDHEEFGAWFRVKLDGPFVAGAPTTGHITHPGYEHLRWEAAVGTMDPPRLFSFRWHPYAIDPDVDYSAEPATLVEFRLEPTPSGTRLTVRESGFDAIPAHRMPEAMQMNERGWAAQIDNIKAFVEG